ncbi:MAG: hypothetical protein IKX58_03665 [Clostridia bacterium]|nr:hypothetical protein [Clostridia bacterium]
MKNTFRSIVAIIMCITICAAFTLPLTGCGEAKKYEAAAALAESGDWEAARAAFLELGEYEDAADRVTVCDYRIAKEAMEAEDYESAEEAFEALGDYEDCAELLTECRYKRALKLYEDEEYADADAIFSEMKDYEDSLHYSTVCRLKYDLDKYLDEIADTINTEFKKEDLPYTLVLTDDLANDDGHRAYIVVPNGSDQLDTTGYDVYLIFDHTDSEGMSTGEGQVNTFTVMGDLDSYTEEGFEKMFTMFLSTAMVLKGAVTEDDDYEAIAESFNSEYEKLFSQVTASELVEIKDQYMGYDTVSSMLVSGRAVRSVYCMSVPELADTDK